MRNIKKNFGWYNEIQEKKTGGGGTEIIKGPLTLLH